MTKRIRKLCDLCDERDVELNVVQFIGGKRKELHICRACAKKVGIKEQLGREDVSFETSLELEHACPNCGWKLKDMIATGLLGCPNCYVEFASEVRPLLGHFHGEKSLSKSVKMDTKYTISILEWQLRKAITEEHFEEAAQIRDKIKQLEEPS